MWDRKLNRQKDIKGYKQAEIKARALLHSSCIPSPSTVSDSVDKVAALISVPQLCSILHFSKTENPHL